MEVPPIPMDSDFIFPAYPTAPSTPKRIHFFTPTRRSHFLQHDFAFHVNEESKPTSISISMEEKIRKGTTTTSSSFSSSALLSSTSRRTQSFSQNRGWECPWEQEEEKQEKESKLVPSYSSLSVACKGSSRKWRFRDLFLFRSASDGRAMDRDPLKKYSAIIRKHDEDFRNSDLRSMGSGSGSKRRGGGGGGVSAHELHYKVNRAVANDLKKKTFLPYKQGILGRLAFNPTVHALSNGFGFSQKN